MGGLSGLAGHNGPRRLREIHYLDFFSQSAGKSANISFRLYFANISLHFQGTYLEAGAWGLPQSETGRDFMAYLQDLRR